MLVLNQIGHMASTRVLQLSSIFGTEERRESGSSVFGTGERHESGFTLIDSCRRLLLRILLGILGGHPTYWEVR